jgi:glycosyltransferase involved in cell wall biosynthesis
MKPLLTIAIPTYNRVGCLRLLIQRLLDEFDRMPDRRALIELVIVNNASQDGTRGFLDELKARVPCVVVHNAENVGMDGNFIKCFQQATGKWFWLFSDDDLPMIGSIEKVLSSLEDADSSIIYLPAAFQPGALDGDRREIEAGLVMHTEGAAAFAARVNGLFTFITCLIANRDEYMARVAVPKYDELIGTYFAHFEWVFELLCRARRFGYFSRPMFVARAENSGGYNFTQVFTDRFLRACKMRLAGRPDLLRLIVNGMRFRHLPKLFYRIRIGRNGDFGFDSADAQKHYLDTYGADPFYAMVMLPVFRFPLPLARFSLFLGRVWGKVWLEWNRRTLPA